jgi:hypothetical protein
MTKLGSSKKSTRGLDSAILNEVYKTNFLFSARGIMFSAFEK